MATFPDLHTLDHWKSQSSGPTLTLPVRGREYTWNAGELPMRAMLLMRRVDHATRKIALDLAASREVDARQVILTDAEDEQLTRDLVGAERMDQMVADGVKWPEFQHVVATLSAWHLGGERAAEVTWNRVRNGTATGRRAAAPPEMPQNRQPPEPEAPGVDTTSNRSE